MACPLREDGVHDCTAANATCPCGYKSVVPRFCFNVEVYDNLTKSVAVSEGFMSNDTFCIIDALASVTTKLLNYQPSAQAVKP